MNLFFHEVKVESDELQIVCLVILPENATKEDIEKVVSSDFPLNLFTCTVTGNKEIVRSTLFNNSAKILTTSYKVKSNMVELVPFSNLVKLKR